MQIPNVASMLSQRVRRWFNNGAALVNGSLTATLSILLVMKPDQESLASKQNAPFFSILHGQAPSSAQPLQEQQKSNWTRRAYK